MPRAVEAEAQRRALEAALQKGGLSIEDVWMTYFTLGGDAGAVEVEAYLHGLMPLSAGQGDVLAHAVNEHLDAMTQRLRVPYERVVTPRGAHGGLLVALIALLEGIEAAPPERLVQQMDEAAAALGVQATIHLVDYGQRMLIPLRVDPAEPRRFLPGHPVAVQSTLGGQAYQRVQTMVGEDDGRARLWVPLLDGVERLGVVDVRLPAGEDPNDPGLHHECRTLSRLLGHLIAVTTGFGDALDSVRRLQPRTGSAELVWNLLPPLTAGTDRIVVAGQFEPTSSVGGDAFDYALSEEHAQLAIFDSTGHTLTSGLVTTAALAAYRAARRHGADLYDQSRAIDETVSTHFPDESLFLTSVLADLDLSSGRLRYINAGHPAPLLLREGRVVKQLTAGRRTLFGLGQGQATIGEEVLQPGDSLVLYTDGITEARDDHGRFFGVDRLSDLLQRADAAGYPPPETVRRLLRAVMDHQHGHLQDDATVLLSTWLDRRPGDAGNARLHLPWY